MPTDTLTFGITRYPGEFIDKIKVKQGLTIAERKNSQGETARVYPHDTKNEVSIEGGGKSPLALGDIEAPGFNGLEGGVFIVKEIEEGETNEGFCDFSVSAMHYPNATLGTAPGNAGA